MDKFLEAVRGHARRLLSDATDANLFGHMGNRGRYKERVIEEFLRPLLPNCYGLGTGEVFSRTGNSSKQIDIVIYDDVFSNVFFRQGDIKLFPCESVYGTIEVKSNLTSDELIKSVENIVSVKELQRDNSTMLDFLPFVELSLGDGLEADKSGRNPYLGYIFSYDGVTSVTATEQLNDLLKSTQDKQLMPDFVFNLEREYVTFRASRGGDHLTPSKQGQDYDTFISVPLDKEEVVVMLFLTLNIQINQIRLRTVRLNEYWINVFQGAVEKLRIASAGRPE